MSDRTLLHSMLKLAGAPGGTDDTRRELLADVRKHFRDSAPDPDAADLTALIAAADMLDVPRDHPDYEARTGAAVEALRNHFDPRRLLRPVARWRGVPEPAPVLWRDPGDPEDGRRPDAVLSVGEVAVLSAPGGTGKSYLSLAIARAAAQATDAYGAACGLRVRAGPVVLVSYEDAPVRLAARLSRMGGDIPARVHCLPDPGPLWTAGIEDQRGQSGRADTWTGLWAGIRAVKPSLVVIDPASAALADVSTSEGGPVRAFMRALGIEAAAAGCGVLVVAHDTKAARAEAKTTGDPGAGAVAGSAQWFDAARGVLYLHTDPHVPNFRIVECIKANHGRRGWGARLAEATDAREHFAGFKLADRIAPADMREATKPPKPQSKKTGGGNRYADVRAGDDGSAAYV